MITRKMPHLAKGKFRLPLQQEGGVLTLGFKPTRGASSTDSSEAAMYAMDTLGACCALNASIQQQMQHVHQHPQHTQKILQWIFTGRSEEFHMRATNRLQNGSEGCSLHYRSVNVREQASSATSAPDKQTKV